MLNEQHCPHRCDVGTYQRTEERAAPALLGPTIKQSLTMKVFWSTPCEPEISLLYTGLTPQ